MVGAGRARSRHAGRGLFVVRRFVVGSGRLWLNRLARDPAPAFEFGLDRVSHAAVEIVIVASGRDCRGKRMGRQRGCTTRRVGRHRAGKLGAGGGVGAGCWGGGGGARRAAQELPQQRRGREAFGHHLAQLHAKLDGQALAFAVGPHEGADAANQQGQRRRHGQRHAGPGVPEQHDGDDDQADQPERRHHRAHAGDHAAHHHQPHVLFGGPQQQAREAGGGGLGPVQRRSLGSGGVGIARHAGLSRGRAAGRTARPGRSRRQRPPRPIAAACRARSRGCSGHPARPTRGRFRPWRGRIRS